MIGIHPDCPPSVALLADHLDAALAAGEDLLLASLPPRADLDEIDRETAPAAIDAFVKRLLQLEASLLLRVLQARRLATEIGRADPALKAAGALFRAQTDTLHELILRAGRTPEGGLVRAGDSHAYFRSRGLIAPEAAAPSPFESLSVGEGFRVGGIVVLSQILDLVSSVLDLLDARFGLYGPEISEKHGPAASEASDEAVTVDADGDTPSLETVIAVVTGKTEHFDAQALKSSTATGDLVQATDVAVVSDLLAVTSEAAVDKGRASADGEPMPIQTAGPEAAGTGAQPGMADDPSPEASKSPPASRSLVSLVAEIGTVS